MHLREVHMENFKSFGRKLVVPFEPGFTGITGPNGSGKSNIGDAVLFVLGPNSPRAIRAGRLTDLIFNGGEHGKPAKNCTVSLVFDNTDRTMPVDSDVVTLTRRVKRTPTRDDPDGYSSYFYVNGRASRKREFVDLLQHARISADGYNITQQGDVLRICTMSNVERRRILDDIAGVTQFDKDIDDADKRRESVQSNLHDISLVLEEIQRNLATLGRERESAQKYKDLQAEISRLKGLMAWRRKTDLEAQVASAQQQIQRYLDDRHAHEAELRRLDDELKQAHLQFSDLEKRIRAEGGEEVAKIQVDIQAVRDRMVRLEEKVNFAKSEVQDAKEEALPLQSELTRIRRERERTAKQQAECQGQHTEAEAALKAARTELERLRDTVSQSDRGAMELNRELGRLKQEHEKGQTALHEARLEADRLETRRAALEGRLQEARGEADATEADRKETEWQLGELETSQKGQDKTRKEMEKRLFALRKEQAETAKQVEDLEGRIRRLQREMAELRAQQDAAARAQGGFGQAVQEVLAARDAGSIRGIIGTISELANASSEHQTALQNAAGGRMQAIVVEDDSVAAQCIEMVKQRRLGRVTLLPLNKMAPGRPRGQALMKVKQPGCLGFALDLIDFNPRYQNAFFYVFGDTLVAEDMAAGRRLMGGVRLVTLTGETFEAAGAMIGGADKRKEGLSFSNADRGRLDEAIGQIADAEDALERAGERLVELRGEIQEAQDALEDDGRTGSGAKHSLKDLQARHASLTDRLKQRLDAVATLEGDLAKATAALAEVQDRIGALEEGLDRMEQERQEKGQLLLKGTKKELRERMEALDAEIRERTETALKAENRADVARQQVALIDDRIKELEGRLAKAGVSGEEHAAQIGRLQDEHKKAKGELDALLKMERQASKQLSGLHDERDKVRERQMQLTSAKDKTATRLETTHGLLLSAKGRLPDLEENLGEALVELRAHPVEVQPEDDVEPYDELRRRFRAKESHLEALGPVNMRALEEYEAAVERDRNLRAEVERLEGQRTDLDKLVAEIATRKKDALMKVFEAINENFAKVYAQLSLGGKALMELENPDDPFAGGLVLKAQPMGKRVTRLDSLSGGEKSLTSMAFIFSIQMYDPSPFYYFDEVDQNLDAINSELLAKLVRQNAEFAQFIVVSLRKITLKEASHIYGVTQQTPGQSEIIANFDIDTLRDEEKPGGHDGEDGDGRDDGRGDDGRNGGGANGGRADGSRNARDDGDVDGAPMLMERPRKGTRETTISEVVAGFTGEVSP